jgi:hypothetical protein
VRSARSGEHPLADSVEVRAATRASGAFSLPPGTNDDALLVELGQISGLTVSLIVRCARGESGSGLIEVYELGPPPPSP